MHSMQCRIGSKGVVNIVRRPYRRIQVQISHIEGVEFVFERDLCGCKIRIRALPSAVRAVINSKLSIMEEIILQFLSAFSAENTFPDLRAGDVIKNLFADPVCHKRIAACFRQGIGKNIIAVDDQCRIRTLVTAVFNLSKVISTSPNRSS